MRTQKEGARVWDREPPKAAFLRFGLGVTESWGHPFYLASLSEAGGNDPVHPRSGPLSPHLPDVTDRVGTRPTHPLIQLDCLLSILLQPFPRLRFQQHMPLLCSYPYGGKSDSGFLYRFGATSLFPVLTFRAPPPSRLVHSFSLPHNVRGILTA
jgi:hypothetical protein